MNALIIGGTGVISSDVVKLAVAKGWDVTLLNRGQRRGGKEPEGVRVIQCDARDEAAVAKAVEGKSYDVVANFIGFTTEQVEQDIRVFREKCGQYIFISTCCVYQKPDGAYLTTESTPLRNVNSAYGQRKIACEELLNHAYRDFGFPITIVRPNWTYNIETIPFIATSWKRPWSIVDRLKKGQPILMPDGGQARFTITHAVDFAEGFVGLMGHEHVHGHAFHIMGDEALTWNQYLAILEKIVGVKANVVNIATDFICKINPQWHDDLAGDKTVTFLFDTSKLKRYVPGFAAKIPYAVGVRQSIEYMSEHPELQLVDEEYSAGYDKLFAAYAKLA